MKLRQGFVSNSSSSSYTCEVCGNTESGWDISLSEIDMIECKKGHYICEGHSNVSPDQLHQLIVDFAEDKGEPWLAEDSELLNAIQELNKTKDTSDYKDTTNEWYESLRDSIDPEWPYEVSSVFCPICMLQDISDYDMRRYLFKKYETSKSDVFDEIKDKFDSYDKLQQYLKKKE